MSQATPSPNEKYITALKKLLNKIPTELIAKNFSKTLPSEEKKKEFIDYIRSAIGSEDIDSFLKKSTFVNPIASNPNTESAAEKKSRPRSKSIGDVARETKDEDVIAVSNLELFLRNKASAENNEDLSIKEGILQHLISIYYESRKPQKSLSILALFSAEFKSKSAPPIT